MEENTIVRSCSVQFAKEARSKLLKKLGSPVVEVTITKQYEGYRVIDKGCLLIIKIKVDSQQVRNEINGELAVVGLHELSKELGIDRMLENQGKKWWQFWKKL